MTEKTYTCPICEKPLTLIQNGDYLQLAPTDPVHVIVWAIWDGTSRTVQVGHRDAEEGR